MIAGLTVKGATPLPTNQYYKAKVLDLEEAMIREFGMAENTDAIAPINHYHCEGNYAREILIPIGSCIIGKIHKHEHINVLSKGSCWVVTEAGREFIEAPRTWISSPGIKRAVFAVTDVVWTTIHPTESSDLDEIEEEVIAKDYSELDKFIGVTL